MVAISFTAAARSADLGFCDSSTSTTADTEDTTIGTSWMGDWTVLVALDTSVVVLYSVAVLLTIPPSVEVLFEFLAVGRHCCGRV